MRNLSSSASGSGYVHSCSRGFWVANTINGDGRGNDSSPIVTCFSSIASRSADWTFGGVLLISSARRIFVKIGHFRTINSHFWGLYISFPVRSDGSKSGVKEILFVSSPRTCASVRIVFVFPSQGTHSIRICQPVNTPTMSFSMSSSCQIICSFTLSRIWMSVSWIWVRAGESIVKAIDEFDYRCSSFFCKKENLTFIEWDFWEDLLFRLFLFLETTFSVYQLKLVGLVMVWVCSEWVYVASHFSCL